MKVANATTIPQLGESGLPSLLSSVPGTGMLSQDCPRDVKISTIKDQQRVELDATFEAMLATVASQAQNPPLAQCPASSVPPSTSVPLEGRIEVKAPPTIPPAALNARSPVLPSIAMLKRPRPIAPTGALMPVTGPEARTAAPQFPVPRIASKIARADGSSEVFALVSPNILPDTIAVVRTMPAASAGDKRNEVLPGQSPPITIAAVPSPIPAPVLDPDANGVSEPQFLTTQSSSRTAESIPLPADQIGQPPLALSIGTAEASPHLANPQETPFGTVQTSDRALPSAMNTTAPISASGSTQSDGLKASQSLPAPPAKRDQPALPEHDATPSEARVPSQSSVDRNLEEEATEVVTSPMDNFSLRDDAKPAVPNSLEISDLNQTGSKEDVGQAVGLRENTLIIESTETSSPPSDNATLDRSDNSIRSFEVVPSAVTFGDFLSSAVRSGNSRFSDARRDAPEEKLMLHKERPAENAASLPPNAQSIPDKQNLPHSPELRGIKSLPEEIASSVHAHRADLVEGKPIELYLRLDPPELGSIRIHLRMSDEAVSVRLIVGDEAATRIIENQLPDLRQSLAERGLAFVRCDVSCDSGRQHQSAFGQDSNLPAGFSQGRPSGWPKVPAGIARSAARTGRLDVLA